MLIPIKILKDLNFADKIVFANRLGTYADTGVSSKNFLMEWEIEYFFNGKHYRTVLKAGDGRRARMVEVE